ncbi:hypothetical protein ABTD95_20075, partial [Acinetobacter baumannii]
PAALTQANTATARKAMADEQHLFALRQREESDIKAQLAARVNQYEQEIHGLESQIHAMQAQRKLIEPERQGVKELWDK